MLALRDGQANQTHLETIGHRAVKERKVAGRGEWREGRGKESLPLGEQSSCSLLFCCCNAHSHTNTHKHSETQTNPCHRWPNHTRLISRQSLCTTLPKGGTRDGRKERDGWGYKVVKLQPSIINLPKPQRVLASQYSTMTCKTPKLANFHGFFLLSLFCCLLSRYVCVF